MTIRINSDVREAFQEQLYNTLQNRLLGWQKLIDIKVIAK
jgi:hypothetical protein